MGDQELVPHPRRKKPHRHRDSRGERIIPDEPTARDHNDVEIKVGDIVTLHGRIEEIGTTGEYNDELLTIDLGDGKLIQMLSRKVVKHSE